MRRLTGVVLVVMLGLALGGGRASAQGSAADKVRAMRAASNKAWADHDVDGYLATITKDFVVTTGSGLARTPDEAVTSIRTIFADPNGQRCVRTAETIELSTAQPLAAEQGHWRCTSTRPDGTRVATGTYLAMWRLEAGGWRTRSELFVGLACSGSADCKP